MKKSIIQIRFNTDNDGSNKYYWRALIDGKEHLVKDIYINVPSKTTMDYIKDKIVYKWHITCESNNYIIKDGVLFIN